MKKLMIAILFLCSISSFATEVQFISIQADQVDVYSNVKMYKMILSEDPLIYGHIIASEL